MKLIALITGDSIADVSSSAARSGKPAEVALAIAWLLDEATYSTGTFVDVTGGL